MFFFGKKDEQLEAKLAKLREEIQKEKNILDAIKTQINLANAELENANNNIELGFYKPTYNFADSLTYKNALDRVIEQEKMLVKNKLAAIITSTVSFNESDSKGRAMQNKAASALIRAFNGEATGIINKVNANNYNQKSQQLIKSAKTLSNLFLKSDFVVLSDEYVDLKLQELKLAVEFALKKQEEKEKLREEKQREREEKQLRAEVERERKNLNKERKQFENAINALLSKEQTDEIESQIEELKSKIALLDEQEHDLDYRLNNAKAGYVYIISNIGSFGKDVYKIGVTRRLEPTDRIDELGSASVPFKFDVHALIFSDDAFKLENELHSQFEKYRSNHVNKRKEYFNVPLESIKNYLQETKDITIEWHDQPENSEFELSNKYNVK